jgi:hypothetical protein
LLRGSARAQDGRRGGGGNDSVTLLDDPFGQGLLSRPARNTSGGDFDPERDIHSIMVNRWNYGYAYELTSLYDPSLFGPNDKQPHVKGRRPYKNVAIANSDSGAFAYTHSAINEAYRAVQDLPG